MVDTDVLRAFAGLTTGTSDTIDENDLRGKVIEATAGLPGSTTAFASTAVDEFAASKTKALSDGFDALAAASRGAADTFEVSEDEAAAAFGRVFVQ